MEDELEDNSMKFQFVGDFVDKIALTGEKLILVSYFTLNLDVLEEQLKRKGLKFVRIDGQIRGDDRQKNVDLFNNPRSSFQILLLCAKAGSTGLNLIGAQRMIMMEPDWNPKNEE